MRYLLVCTVALLGLLSPKLALAQAKGVELSEIVRFNNLDITPNQVLPLESGFALYTYRQVSTNQAMRGRFLGFGTGLGRNQLNEVTRFDIHRYGQDLRAKESIPVSWRGARDLLSVFSVGDNVVWNYATETRDKDRYEIRAAVIDARGKEIENHRLTQIDRKDYAGLQTYNATSLSRNYTVRVFAEQSENRAFSKRDDQPATISVAVFNNAGELVTDLTKRLRMNRDQLDIQNVSVDEQGTAYIAARVFANGRRVETMGGSDSEVFVYTVPAGGEASEGTVLDLAGQYIQALQFYPTPDGPPAILGLYTERRGNRLRGVFATRNPTSGETLKPQRFSDDLLNSLGKRVTAGKGDNLRLEGDFEFLDSQILPDGSLAVLLEDYRETVRTDPNTGRIEVNYDFREGIVLTFDPEGTVTEAWVVPKVQRDRDFISPFSRMKLVPYEGGVGVLYNDSAKNLTRTLDDRTRALRFKDAIAVIAYIDNGELKRRPLFGRREADKMLMVPSSGTQLEDEGIVFVAMRYKMFGKNELRFGLLEGR